MTGLSLIIRFDRVSNGMKTLLLQSIKGTQSMVLNAADVYEQLLEEAIDCSVIPKFSYYASMTTAYAERVILSLLKERCLYRYNGNILIKMFGRLCYIQLNKKSTLPDVGAFSDELAGVLEEEEIKPSVRVTLPFSPKHICRGMYKCRDIRRIEDGNILNHICLAITD